MATIKEEHSLTTPVNPVKPAAVSPASSKVAATHGQGQISNQAIDNLSGCLGIVSGKEPQKLTSFGVILDVTGAYKTNDSVDYVTKVKLVDPTFHYKLNPTNLKSYVHVFIYSDSPESVPRTLRVGDILKLKNFFFSTYQHSEVKAVYRKESEWALFHGKTDANFVPIGKSKVTIASQNALSQADKDAITHLRTWSSKFFSENSIKQMNWFSSHEKATPVPKIGTFTEVRDVDIMAKVLVFASFLHHDKVYHKIAFADEHKKVYFAEYHGRFDHVVQGNIVKLRSVNVILSTEVSRIIFQNYSAVLLVPKEFKDHQTVDSATTELSYSQDQIAGFAFDELHLDKMIKTQIGPNTFSYSTPAEGASEPTLGNKQSTGKAVAPTGKSSWLRSFPFLENYIWREDDLDEAKNSRPERRTSSFLKPLSSMKSTPLSELASMQAEASTNDAFAIEHQHKVFTIKASIIGFENSDISTIAKLYSPRSNSMWELSAHAQATKAASDVQVLLHNVFYVRDSSLGGTLTLPIYLLSFDLNPANIFGLWGALPSDHLAIPQWVNLSKAKKERFEEGMKSIKGNECELAVQMMVNRQGKVYFRLVDSIFWTIPKKTN